MSYIKQYTMPGIQTKLQRWYWEHGIGNESRQKSGPKIEEEFSRTKKCFLCGEQNPKFLEEHHLIPKRLHDLLPAEFHIIFDFERTVTLCRNCHRRFHVLIKELVTVLEKVLNLDKDNGLYVYDRIMLFLLLNLNGWYLKEVYAEYEVGGWELHQVSMKYTGSLNITKERGFSEWLKLIK